MKIGIICEGVTDGAVLKNILKGQIGIDSSDIIMIRPEESLDETDLAKEKLSVEKFSNWSIVKEECETRTKISSFLTIEGNELMILHVDTAEADEYGVERPAKSDSYCTEMRNSVCEKIKEWLEHQFLEDVVFAVAVEEIEAWVLTIYDDRNSCDSANPKSKLQYICRQKGHDSSPNAKAFQALTKDFRKKRNYVRKHFFRRNESLKLFCDDLQEKVKNKTITT